MRTLQSVHAFMKTVSIDDAAYNSRFEFEIAELNKEIDDSTFTIPEAVSNNAG